MRNCWILGPSYGLVPACRREVEACDGACRPAGGQRNRARLTRSNDCATTLYAISHQKPQQPGAPAAPIDGDTERLLQRETRIQAGDRSFWKLFVRRDLPLPSTFMT